MEYLSKVMIASLELIESDESVIISIEAQEHLSALAQLLSFHLQVGDDGADA